MSNELTLFCSGDSYTYGEELEDLKDRWPNKLATKLNATVINKAVCSGSNEYIFKTINDFILDCIEMRQNFNNVIVIVGWSTSIRWEGYLSDCGRLAQLKLWRSLRLVDTSVPKIFREDEMIENKILSKKDLDLYNEISQDFMNIFKRDMFYNFYCKAHLMFSTHCLLKSFKINHLFFNSLREKEEFCYRKMNDEATEWLHKINQMNRVMQQDNCLVKPSMDEYCKKYPIGKKEGHPLTEGHEAWAEYLHEKLLERND